MADEPETPETAAPKPKKGKKKLILILAGVLLIGGAGAGGFLASGMLGGGHAEASEKKVEKATPLYLPIDASFTANVKDSDAVMQVALGVSTLAGQPVIDAVKTHDLPIRSAVLMTLADADGDSLFGNTGKQQLRRKLKIAINDVLKSKGEGEIEDVYFTNFIIQ